MTQSTMMKAVICTKYGPPNVLQLRQDDVKKPVPQQDEVLIKIHATSVTASDALIRGMTNQPLPLRCLLQSIFGFGKPRNPILGMTLSGEIAEESEGKGSKFQKGDKVFAYGSISAMNRRFGSYAEYICLPSENWNLLPKPTNLTHLEAAAIPYGGFLALHMIQKMMDDKIDQAQSSGSGQSKSVLVYGASGSIGTMVIQLLLANKNDENENVVIITAVCSSRNFELVKSLGATKVIDYTNKNAESELEDKYDFVFDAVGNTKTSPLKEKSKKHTKNYISIDDDALFCTEFSLQM